jgi:hypothetical protein
LRDRISALELKLAELTGAIDILRGTTPPPARDTRALGELLSTEHRKFGDHPLTGIELRALRRLQREQKPGRYVFTSERGAPMSAVPSAGW